MARYSGKIGYGHTVNKGNSVFKTEITERPHKGDVLYANRRLSDEPKINDDITAGNRISIVADAYATENYFAIRYVWWNGARWKVRNVDVQRPRLILTLGGVYNGPGPSSPA